MLALLITIVSLNAQENTKSEPSAELLELPGDNLDLYATLKLFQQSKTIEEFETSLNDEKTGINNLDLNLDGDVDFIKVSTQQENDDFAIVLQVDILKDEIQDVAVILITKDKDEKVTLQMVGNEELYGKDYIIEPVLETPAVTANPAYSGPDTVVVKSAPATVVVIESEPIVHYVYSPVYVPYYPPYYYGYYPPYYHPYPVISINIYVGRNHHHHNHYHGGHRGGGNSVIINNNNTYNNYNRTKKTSNTVVKNKNQGSYKRNEVSKRSSSGVEKNDIQNNKKSVPNTKENATKNSVKENKSSGSTNKSDVKQSSKSSSKSTGRPAIKSSGKLKRR